MNNTKPEAVAEAPAEANVQRMWMIDDGTFNRLFNYLMQRPMSEVEGVVSLIRKTAKQVEVPLEEPKEE